MNISSAILSIYNIGDLNFDDYKELLFASNNRTSNYRFKHITSEHGILAQNLKNGNPFMIHCVKKYYGKEVGTPLANTLLCDDIRSVLGVENSRNCLECHKNCCTLYINNELVKIASKK